MRSLISLVGLALAFVLPSLAYGDVLDDWQSSRLRISPFAAEYREVIEASGEQEAVQGTTSWGAGNSTHDYFCWVGPKASFTSQKPETLSLPGSNEKTLWAHQVYFENGVYRGAVGDGLQGYYGKRPPEVMNVASCAYEVFTAGIDELYKYGKPTVTGPLTVSIRRPTTVMELGFRRFGDQLCLERIEGPLSATAYYTHVVNEWIEFRGSHYPKVVTQQFARNGEVFQTRSYRLLKVLPEKSAGVDWKWSEGAIVKDTDTQKVYFVRNGSLVLDARFNSEPSYALSITNIIILIGFAVLGVAGLMWLRNRSQNTVKLS